ncbi:hypothetical protein A3L04_06435 [Thermococcus chitonophagus]|uniref:Uncharacterized protein n=1 Tax=Thermococcus chitonophagus TaxID=54262 RepID=A0A160VWC8_9EURY|nr:hypothetical protein [Thermococcus chitonophagus]ASJ16735.1 hypothetical protein A3L04_06435 [Thermococcus chitonophagus]CUX78201.1 hypothetical protein, conserved, containing leucine zipper motif [Thermococcus chitonophagus]
MERFSPSPTPSPFVVTLKVFLITFAFASAYLTYSTFHTKDPLTERLFKLGYPTEGYIIENGTIKFANGIVVKIQGTYIESYKITAEDALKLANQYLADYNSKLREYNYELVVDEKTLREEEKDGTLYWVFDMKLKKGHSSWYVGSIWIDRKTGLVAVKGILG